MIRYDILQKLRLDENRLPNVTAIPPDYLATLTGIVDMQNDAPQEQYDDDHATTEKIIAFSRTRESKFGFYFHFHVKAGIVSQDLGFTSIFYILP
jgi:hypothetical protein